MQSSIFSPGILCYKSSVPVIQLHTSIGCLNLRISMQKLVNLLEIVQERQYFMKYMPIFQFFFQFIFIFIVTPSLFHHTTHMSFILFLSSKPSISKDIINYRHTNLQESNNNRGSLEVSDIYSYILHYCPPQIHFHCMSDMFLHNNTLSLETSNEFHRSQRAEHPL